MSVTPLRRTSSCTFAQSGSGRAFVTGPAPVRDNRASSASSSRSSGNGQPSPASLARLT